MPVAPGDAWRRAGEILTQRHGGTETQREIADYMDVADAADRYSRGGAGAAERTKHQGHEGHQGDDANPRQGRYDEKHE
jgi:hypothetical protein